MSSAQHGERRGGRAIGFHAIDSGRGAGDRFCCCLGVAQVLGRNDDRRHPPERRRIGFAAAFGFGGVKGVCIARHQRADHGRAGIMRLDENTPGLGPATGASADLRDLLKAALRRAEVAALQAKIGIDHAHQRQVREVIAFGHELRADDNVDVARFHPPDEFGGLGGRPERIRRDNDAAGGGKQQRNFIGNALDARPHGNERILFLAFGAFAWWRHHVPAMMALQPPDQAMFDHPRGAIGTLKTVPAGPAQSQRRIAAAIEEQQHLLAARQHVVDGAYQRRRDPPPALGRIAQQVDGGNLGHFCNAITTRQLEFLVMPQRHLRLRFDGRGRGGEHHRTPLEPPAHDGHVARMIMDAVFLLETGLMRFVDNDQTKIAVRQKQCRPRADRHQRFAR